MTRFTSVNWKPPLLDVVIAAAFVAMTVAEAVFSPKVASPVEHVRRRGAGDGVAGLATPGAAGGDRGRDRLQHRGQPQRGVHHAALPRARLLHRGLGDAAAAQLHRARPGGGAVPRRVGDQDLRAERPRSGGGVLRRAVGCGHAAEGPDRQRRRGGRQGRAARARAGGRGGPGRRRGAHPDRPRAARHRVPLDQRRDHPDPGRTPPARPRARRARRPTSQPSRRRRARRSPRCAGSSACCAPRASRCRWPPSPASASSNGWCARWARATCTCELRVEGEPVPLSPGVDLAAYRIAQEGLTNAVRHAARERGAGAGALRAATPGHRGGGQRAGPRGEPERRARPGRDPRAGRAVRRLGGPGLLAERRGPARGEPAAGGGAHEHPAGDRRRPGHGAGRVPLAARRRARLRGGRRGRQRRGGGRGRLAAAPGRDPDGHPDAGARRHRCDARSWWPRRCRRRCSC